MIGKILQGRYEIVKSIGFGGMADVYLAKDVLLDRRVAVKVLRKQFLNDKAQLEQFEREARSAARLIHPDIVNIFDVAQEGDLHYIVMEYVDGITLKTYLEQKGKLDVFTAVNIAAKLASALQHAHKHHIIHCDIKPQNILLGENLVPKIVDFGISRMVSNETRVFTSSLVGSVHYISPEQARGETLTSQSDIYSLGVVLFEMLTGRVPFDGQSAVAVAMMHVNQEPPRLSSLVANVPAKLQTVLDKALAKNLADRYQSAEDFRRDLTAIKAEYYKEEELSPEVLAQPQPLPQEQVEEDLPFASRSSLTDGAKDETIIMKNPERPQGASGDTTIIMKSPVGTLSALEAKRQEHNKKLRKKLMIGVLAILAVLFSLVGFYFWYTTPTVEVPGVVGMSVVEAQKKLMEVGFKVKLEEVVQKDVTPGTVVKQDPAAKTKRKEGATVTIFISRGLELGHAPNVVGMPLEKAREALKKAGYEVGNISKQWDKNKSEGVVLSMTPTAVTMVPKGSKIDLVVNADEDKPKDTTLPSVVGLKLAEAKQKLADAGLSNVEVQTVDSSKAADTVVAVSPEAGASVKTDAKITLQVSNGKAKVEPPKTNTGSSESVTGSRYVEFTVPGNSGEHEIKVVVSDSQRQWVAYEGKVKSGSILKQRVDTVGHAKVQFLVDKKVVDEKSW